MGCKVYYFSGAYQQKLKIRMNIDQLFSKYHEENLVIKIIKYKREHPEYTAKIMLDSGAFTHYQQSLKKGIVLSDKDIYDYTDNYISFLNEWGDDLECFVGVDSVPNPENVDPTYIVKTWENYLYMWERLKPSIRHKLIPVFHYGEDFNHLRKWLDYRHPDGSKVEYVGLAISLEGVTKERIAWGRQAMKVIAESTNPNVKTHAFGVGVKAVLEHIDVTSTDATSWVKAAAYGMIKVEDKPVGVSSVHEEMLNGKHFGERCLAYTDAIEELVHKRGFRLKPYSAEYVIEDNEAVFNIEGVEHRVKMIDNTHIEMDGNIFKFETMIETSDNVDKFYGTWEYEESSLTFDGKGKVLYDNGKCLSTNCYARAEFNIIDVLTWMKELEEKEVKLTAKKDLW